MSRSRKRTPVSGNTIAESDKAFKVISHRQERAAARSAAVSDEDAGPPHPKEHGNPWKSQKDGKHWFGGRHPHLMRK